MELNERVLRPFVGGQVEIQNRTERYLYRGEIKAIRVEGEGDDADLVIELEWMAKGEGYPPGADRWVRDDPKPYRASLMIYAVSDINQGRVCLISGIVGEVVVLYPQGGSALDRSKVEGL